ncbi:hypothetical protein MRX96_035324 [Rhipicephalus microplus]
MPALSPEPLSQDSCLFLLTGTPGCPFRSGFRVYAANGTHLGLPILQETCAMIEEQYSGHLHLYMDGSRLTRKFTVIVRSGCDVSFQWVPLHVGVRGYEVDDALAKDVHDPSTPATNFIHSYDVCGRSSHATSALFTRTPAQQPANLSHACRQRESRGSGSPSCVQCPADETVEHILCQCPGYADIRHHLCNTYVQLGLPQVSPEHVLFPSANVATLLWAFNALLNFFGDAHVFTRL